MSPQYLDTAQGRRVAFRRRAGHGPTVVFLGGLRSDMEGTKALFLEDWARAQGRAFVRFDYSGHGHSSGRFEDGAIGDWAEDTAEVLARLTEGPLVLVGSSMGGWQALLATRAAPERVAGLVTIAAAPDFTEDGWWAGFSDAQRYDVMEHGQTALPSDYGAPMVVTRRMIEDGRRHLVLRRPLRIGCPARLLHGTADETVAPSLALRLLDHAEGPDLRLTLVKGADHRFSDAPCLGLIADAVTDLCAAATPV